MISRRVIVDLVHVWFTIIFINYLSSNHTPKYTAVFFLMLLLRCFACLYSYRPRVKLVCRWKVMEYPDKQIFLSCYWYSVERGTKDTNR